MVTHVQTIAQDKVGDGTALDADVFVHDLFYQTWRPGNVEAVTDSLRPQQNGIVHVPIVATVALARVQVHLKLFAFVDRLGFCLVDLWKELFNRRREVFLLHHVEANNQVGELLRSEYGVDCRLYLLFVTWRWDSF